MEAPEEFKDLIGTTQTMGGCLFGSKDIPMEEYKVLDWRWGSGKIFDMKTLKVLHPTVELLVKREDMRASRWTRGFPCRSIKLDEEND